MAAVIFGSQLNRLDLELVTIRLYFDNVVTT